MEPPRIRTGRETDLPRLVEILNPYVEQTHITFDVEPFTVDSRRSWFEQFDEEGIHRLFVAECEGRVQGYATSSVHRSKPAYGRSVETTIYLARDATGRGIGRALYSHLLDGLREDPRVHRAFAGVTLPNPASIALHEGLDFRRIGIFHEIGFKFGKYWDVQWYECDLAGNLTGVNRIPSREEIHP